MWFYIDTSDGVKTVQANDLNAAQLAVVKATGIAVADQRPMFGGNGFDTKIGN